MDEGLKNSCFEPSLRLLINNLLRRQIVWQRGAQIIFAVENAKVSNQAAARPGNRLFIGAPFLIGRRRRLIAG